MNTDLRRRGYDPEIDKAQIHEALEERIPHLVEDSVEIVARNGNQVVLQLKVYENNEAHYEYPNHKITVISVYDYSPPFNVDHFIAWAVEQA